MRRWLSFLAALLLLCPCPAAAAPVRPQKCVALTFDAAPSAGSRQLLAELDRRGVKATFFLCGSALARDPGFAGEVLAGGHEIGIQGYSPESMVPLSRREIAAQLADTRALLPGDCPVAFLRPPGGICSDGVRQVARARRLAILDRTSISPDRAADGDVIVLPTGTAAELTAALAGIDRLLERGFTCVTVSELARRAQVRLKPGVRYRSFPPEEQKSAPTMGRG